MLKQGRQNLPLYYHSQGLVPQLELQKYQSLQEQKWQAIWLFCALPEGWASSL